MARHGWISNDGTLSLDYDDSTYTLEFTIVMNVYRTIVSSNYQYYADDPTDLYGLAIKFAGHSTTNDVFTNKGNIDYSVNLFPDETYTFFIPSSIVGTGATCTYPGDGSEISVAVAYPTDSAQFDQIKYCYAAWGIEFGFLNNDMYLFIVSIPNNPITSRYLNDEIAFIDTESYAFDESYVKRAGTITIQFTGPNNPFTELFDCGIVDPIPSPDNPQPPSATQVNKLLYVSEQYVFILYTFMNVDYRELMVRGVGNIWYPLKHDSNIRKMLIIGRYAYVYIGSGKYPMLLTSNTMGVYV